MSSLNPEVRVHRMLNQRRIALSLIERIQTLLAPGVAFSRELANLFNSQGKFGSRDRRFYRELIFTYLRYQPWVEPLRAADKETFLDTLLAIAAPIEEIQDLYPSIRAGAPRNLEFDDRHHLLGKSDEDLFELLPSWFLAHFSGKPTVDDIKPFFRRAPLWLRVQNGNALTVVREIETLKKDSKESARLDPEVPDAIRAPNDLPLVNLPAYQNGQVEVQDISSQLLLQLLDPEPQGRWLDACAGAGGKTLQLAKMLKPFGQAFAYDDRQAALKELDLRKTRSGLPNIEILHARPYQGEYDGVLVDAPCSGSGTWRRSPFLMRQMREQDIMAYAEKQLNILDLYSKRVASGGRLVYCTCSLSRFENEQVAARFVKARPEFKLAPLAEKFGLRDEGHGITVYPAAFDGDGLYIAQFVKA